MRVEPAYRTAVVVAELRVVQVQDYKLRTRFDNWKHEWDSGELQTAAAQRGYAVVMGERGAKATTTSIAYRF